MSTWGHKSRLGDARLTVAAMDKVRGVSGAVARAMFFGAPTGGGVTVNAALTLAMASLAASAAVAPSASGAQAMPMPALSALASVAVAGSAAQATPASSLSAQATVGALAGATCIVPALGLSSSVAASVAAVAVLELPMFTVDAHGIVGQVDVAMARPARRVQVRARSRLRRFR